MIAWEAHPEGVIIPVLAQPGARRTGFNSTHDGHLKIQVTAAPEKGKANEAILQLLAKTFSIPKSRIELLSGATSSRKRFLVRDINENELRGQLPFE